MAEEGKTTTTSSSSSASDQKLAFINVSGSGMSSAAAPSSSSSSHSAPTNNSSANEGLISGTLRQTRHPVATIFHFLFKFAALFFYIFASFISTSFVFIFVLCILCLAFDFWTVKNVTGRLLVGLRWWNSESEDDEDDENNTTTKWVFESVDDMSEIGMMDARLFWWGLYSTSALWSLLGVIALLKFNIEWLLIIAIALTLTGANVLGYTKCSKDAKNKLGSTNSAGGAVSAAMLSSVMSNAGSSIFSNISNMMKSTSGATANSPSSIV